MTQSKGERCPTPRTSERRRPTAWGRSPSTGPNGATPSARSCSPPWPTASTTGSTTTPSPRWEETRAAYSAICLRLYGTLLDYPKPTIAACAGPTLGGGCDIAVFSDIRIGADNAVFGFPQIKFGLTPYFSPLWKIVGLSQAKLLTFTGDRIDAAEALRIGLIDRLVPIGTVVETATKLARSIADTTTASAMINKEMALRSPAMDPISALSYETLAYREVIRRPDVNRRMQEAFARLRSRAGARA